MFRYVNACDLPLTEYSVRRDRVWISFAVGVLASVAFIAAAFLIQGIWAAVCLAAGLMLAGASVHALGMLVDKRPILRISPEGLYYRPFAARTAPWSDITAITHMMAYTRSVWLGRVNWTRTPANDQINFAVADPSHYPNDVGRSITRAMQRLGGLPPIIIQLYVIDATPDAIRAEIAKHWDGEIATFDPRPLP